MVRGVVLALLLAGLGCRASAQDSAAEPRFDYQNLVPTAGQL
jgi:hypothetical protein